MLNGYSKRTTALREEEVMVTNKFTKIFIMTYLLDKLIQVSNGIRMLKFIQKSKFVY